MPAGHLEAVWQRILEPDSGTGLDASKLRILSDSQRLTPAAVRDGVLADVLHALSCGKTLDIGYRDAGNKVTNPVIHPQALLKRGPRVYLFAMKNEESLVRMYASFEIHSSSDSRLPARVPTTHVRTPLSSLRPLPFGESAKEERVMSSFVLLSPSGEFAPSTCGGVR